MTALVIVHVPRSRYIFLLPYTSHAQIESCIENRLFPTEIVDHWYVQEFIPDEFNLSKDDGFLNV